MNSQSPKPSYIPMAIDNILRELEKLDNVSERLEYLENYLKRYKEELFMVKNWRPTLPQYMLILVEALEIMKDSIYRTGINVNDGDARNKMLVDEFLAWKRRIYENELLKLSDASSSSSSLSDQTACNGKRKEIGINRTEGALDNFPFKYDEHDNIPKNIKLDSHDSVIEISKTTKNSEPLKERRTWTPELHHKFVEAMKTVGGPKSASPKQIKEVMNVEGLTNDQIKSHLQKYRLHKKVILDKKDTAKIDGSDDSPNHDQKRRHFQTPNLNIGIWDDQDDEPQAPVEKNVGAGDVSTSGIKKGDFDMSTSVVEKNLGGDDVSTSGLSHANLIAWVNHYFNYTGNEF